MNGKIYDGEILQNVGLGIELSGENYKSNIYLFEVI